jgi:hypothetical protein
MRGNGVPSTSQFSCEITGLQIHNEKNFKKSHKKESLIGGSFIKDLSYYNRIK